jgi:hypothetical protein
VENRVNADSRRVVGRRPQHSSSWEKGEGFDRRFTVDNTPTVLDQDCGHSVWTREGMSTGISYNYGGGPSCIKVNSKVMRMNPCESESRMETDYRATFFGRTKIVQFSYWKGVEGNVHIRPHSHMKLENEKLQPLPPSEIFGVRLLLAARDSQTEQHTPS